MCLKVRGYHLGRCLMCIEPLAVRAHKDQGILIQRLLLAVRLEQLVKERCFLDPEGHPASILHEAKHLRYPCTKSKVCVESRQCSMGARSTLQRCSLLSSYCQCSTAALSLPEALATVAPHLVKSDRHTS